MEETKEETNAINISDEELKKSNEIIKLINNY